MFVDEAVITVKAGNGGDGSASFRREKYVPMGGPNGGDGGDGGHVFVRVKENSHGLAAVVATRQFQAQNGERGRGKKQHGANGKSITIDVPPGTIVYELGETKNEIRKSGASMSDSVSLTDDEGKIRDSSSSLQNNSQLLIDTATLTPDEMFRVAKGGKGGLGNVHFATATHQAPTEITRGTPGQKKTLKLVVSHIADVGLVGLPNVGKSTFLARVSDARPKIANYPFTTLEPHLGVVSRANVRFVIADIPGLIEGASAGKGLGHQFLQHLARTKVLLHLVDAQSTTPIQDYKAIRSELSSYDPALVNKPEVIAISRSDTLSDKQQRSLWNTLHNALGHIAFLSSQSGRGVNDILRELAEEVGS